MLNFDKKWIEQMVGKSLPIDKVTKEQKKVINSKNIKQMFGDWDKDGVIKGLDRQPRNKNKHSNYPGINPKNYRVSDDSYYLGTQATDKTKFKEKMKDIWGN